MGIKSSASVQSGSQNRGILVVEPNVYVSEFLQRALQETNSSVLCAGTAAASRHFLATRHIRLAIIEMRLPDANGMELADEMLAAGIPVVLMSGHPEAIQQAAMASCTFLVKPFRLADMMRAVRASNGCTAKGLGIRPYRRA